MALLNEEEKKRQQKINPNATFDSNGQEINLNRSSFLSRFMDRAKATADYRAKLTDHKEAFGATISNDVLRNNTTTPATPLAQLSDTGKQHGPPFAPFKPVSEQESPMRNWLKDEATGKVFTEADLPKESAGQGRMGGYNLDGSRIVPSGKQGDQGALKMNNLSQGLPSREERLKQWDYQEGLKSGRYQKPIDPTDNMSEKERIAYRATQAGIDNNIIDNKTTSLRDANQNTNASERNDILREQGLASIKPPASQVIKNKDYLGNETSKIMNQQPDGSWVDATPMQETPEISFLRNDPSEYNKKMFKKKYGYLPAWAL